MSRAGFSTRTDLMIQEYQDAHLTSGAHSWDPRLKLALLVCVVAVNVGVARLPLSLALLTTSILFIVLSRIPWRLFAIFFLAPTWATLLVVAGFAVGFGSTPLLSIGHLTVYREGLQSGLSAGARVASDMSWMALVFLTTPFAAMLNAARWFRVPDVLVDATAMTYRYAFILLDEFHRMYAAARCRGGLRSYVARMQSIGAILAQVILRAYDRAAAVQTAMVARGGGVEPGQQAMHSVAPSVRGTRGGDDLHRDAPADGASATNGAPLLSTRELSFSYAHGGLHQTDRLGIDVGRGEVVVICGPNGCGKSTLLKLFAGILTAESGQILLGGRLLDRKMRNEAFRHVGLLFQDPDTQLFCPTVQEDVAYGPTNMGLPPQECTRLAEEAMQVAQVSHLASRPIHQLSHGEMKRVGLAGLISMGPPLLLLDEPSAYLDPAATEQIIQTIEHLNRRHGYTFIVVTHDMDLAARIATRIVVLNAGKIAADGQPARILTDEALLRSVRLEPPLLTQLFHRLAEQGNWPGDRPMPLTLSQAVLELGADRGRPAP